MPFARFFLNKKEEAELEGLFELGLVLKAATGALEMGAAIATLLIPPHLVLHLADVATQGELGADPDDFISHWIRATAHSFALHGHYLIGAYLLLHGFVKSLLAILILRGVRSAYPLFIASLLLFGSYEAYRGLIRHELILGFLAIFDFVLLILAVHEYHRSRRATPHPGTV